MAEKQAEKVAPKPDEAGGIEANQFFGAMAEAIKGAFQAGVREVNPRRDNPNYVPDEDRAPAGVTKNALTRRVIFKGIVQEEKQLTPEEIDLFNQLVAPIETTMVMNGMPPKAVTVKQNNNGTIPDLTIDFPLSIEERAYMPSLKKILRGLIAGATVIE